ncbi:MAG: type II toxin-antitoxin system RelE family toxin, partial [Opitutaceae bacterium]
CQSRGHAGDSNGGSGRDCGDTGRKSSGLNYRIKVEPQVAGFAATLGMQHRRMFKRAILGLAKENGDIRALTDQLSGYYRLRIGRFRVIFRYRPDREIQCVYAEERGLVYDLFEAEMRRLIGGTRNPG